MKIRDRKSKLSVLNKEWAMRYQGRTWKFGDNINTDMIIAGKHLSSSDPEILRRYCFAGADPEWAARVRPGDIVIGGRNFGCGSSREHAPAAIKAAGVSCIVAASFGAIFFRNAVNVGLPVIVCPEAAAALRTGSLAVVDLEHGTVTSEDGCWSFARAGETVSAILNAGGLIPYIREQHGLGGLAAKQG